MLEEKVLTTELPPLNGLMEFAKALPGATFTPVKRKPITALEVLNEAYHYERPSSFSRGMRLELNGLVVLLISGTASIGDHGETLHVGDFRAQCRRMWKN